MLEEIAQLPLELRFTAFFDDVDDKEDEDAAVALLPEPPMISDSIHIWAKPWHMHSSMFGLSVRYPGTWLSI